MQKKVYRIQRSKIFLSLYLDEKNYGIQKKFFKVKESCTARFLAIQDFFVMCKEKRILSHKHIVICFNRLKDLLCIIIVFLKQNQERLLTLP